MEKLEISGKEIKSRAMAIRLRTLSLTLVILVTLVFYLLVSVYEKSMIDWIDFVILCIVQILMHCLYFPDGELYGQTNARFINNRNAYNEKATLINKKRQMKHLREFAKVDYLQRQQNYIETQCGFVGISMTEYEFIKANYSEKQIKTLDKIEIDGRLYFLSKHKRKILNRVLFKALPVGYNNPETIMSAIENDGSSKITDKSKSYKIGAYVKKVFTAIVIGGIMAYIGYKAKDGFGIDDVVRMLMYLSSMLSTAILSYSSGEVCQRVYKCQFYLELSLFIDNFFEWLALEKKIDIEKFEYKIDNNIAKVENNVII